MLPITNLKGETFLLTNVSDMTLERSVNGEKSISFSVLPDVGNDHVWRYVETESIVEFEGLKFVIKQVDERNFGHKSIKNVYAIHDFFDVMRNIFEYNEWTGSQTFNAALNRVFGGTPYNYQIIDEFSARQFENFGKDSKLSLFKNVLDRYGAEFEITGNTVRLRRETGSNTGFQYRWGYNVQAIDYETNTRDLATVIKGFGGEPDESGNYPIQKTYTSDNINIFGEIHAPAVYDERYTTSDGMLERLKDDLIDEPQLSITIDIEDLRASGYYAETVNEGDTGYIIYEPMGIDVEARIVEIKEDYEYREVEWRPTSTSVTLSNIRGNIQDVMTRFSNTSKSFNRLMNGVDRLPDSSLQEATRIATELLKQAQTELEFGNGILAINPNNPNEVVVFNSAGVGVSNDGGQTFKTAMTGQGIVAEAIVAGYLEGMNIRGGTVESLNGAVVLDLNNAIFDISGGGQINFTDPGNGIKYTNNAHSSGMIMSTTSGTGGLPMIAIGTDTGSGVINANSSNFTGVRIHSLDSGSRMTFIGGRYLFSTRPDLSTGGFAINTDGNEGTRAIYGWNSSTYNYDLGRDTSQFSSVFTRNIRASEDVHIRDAYSSGGWLLETRASAGSTTITLRGINTGSWNYNLGSSGWRINRIFLSNSPDVSSDERLKEDIKDNGLGLDFIKEIKTKKYRLKQTNADLNKNPLQIGILAQQLKKVLEKHNIDTTDQSLVNEGSDGMYGVQYEQLIAPVIKAIQEMSVELEEEKQKNRDLEDKYESLLSRIEALEE
jgi:phage minor structural protein